MNQNLLFPVIFSYRQAQDVDPSILVCLDAKAFATVGAFFTDDLGMYSKAIVVDQQRTALARIEFYFLSPLQINYSYRTLPMPGQPYLFHHYAFHNTLANVKFSH
jgi:hypothetical protein